MNVQELQVWHLKDAEVAKSPVTCTPTSHETDTDDGKAEVYLFAASHQAFACPD